MAAYYNEHDPKAAAWIRELIKDGLVAPGDVDERSIEDIVPSELRKYTQLHFFAGIAVWSYALRLAGWRDDERVITGSCPCQSFSAAGKRKGFDDERHLWPAWFHLISQLQHTEFRSVPVFGEQVLSKDSLAWLDLVSDDLEGIGYSIGSLGIPACSVGAPHRRLRLYFVADTESSNGRLSVQRGESRQARPQFERSREARIMADSNGGNASTERLQRSREHGQRAEDGGAGGMEHAASNGLSRRDGGAGPGQIACEARIKEQRHGLAGKLGDTELSESPRLRQHGGQILPVEKPEGFGLPSFTNGFWADAEWIYCTDGKYRPTKPGIFPLANGTPGRVALLRGAGNAINAEQAKAFIESYREVTV